MSETSLLFVRADRATAERLAKALEENGVAPDMSASAIEDLSPYDAVVVLFSNHSVKSPLVMQAAKTAMEAGKLAPVFIGMCAVPPPFNNAPLFDLADWDGEAENLTLQRLAQTLRRLRQAKDSRRRLHETFGSGAGLGDSGSAPQEDADAPPVEAPTPAPASLAPYAPAPPPAPAPVSALWSEGPQTWTEPAWSPPAPPPAPYVPAPPQPSYRPASSYAPAPPPPPAPAWTGWSEQAWDAPAPATVDPLADPPVTDLRDFFDDPSPAPPASPALAEAGDEPAPPARRRRDGGWLLFDVAAVVILAGAAWLFLAVLSEGERAAILERLGALVRAVLPGV